jgi:uncharacterized protein YlaI
MNDIKFRLAKADLYCRGCDREVKRNKEWVIATYSFRNRGQHIYFCYDCAKKISDLITNKE